MDTRPVHPDITPDQVAAEIIELAMIDLETALKIVEEIRELEKTKTQNYENKSPKKCP